VEHLPLNTPKLYLTGQTIENECLMTKKKDLSQEADLPAVAVAKAGNSQILLYRTDEGDSKPKASLLT